MNTSLPINRGHSKTGSYGKYEDKLADGGGDGPCRSRYHGESDAQVIPRLRSLSQNHGVELRKSQNPPPWRIGASG